MELIKRTFLNSEDVSPMAFYDAIAVIRCKQHSPTGVNNVSISGGYFAYGWHDSKLCLYMSSHVVDPDQELLKRIYEDVFACSHWKVSKIPIDGF